MRAATRNLFRRCGHLRIFEWNRRAASGSGVSCGSLATWRPSPTKLGIFFTGHPRHSHETGQSETEHDQAAASVLPAPQLLNLWCECLRGDGTSSKIGG
jgi:hypothetical protein